MTTTKLGLAAAAVLALASFSAPALAFQAPLPAGASSHVSSDVTQARFHRRPVCVVRTVVSRGPHGRKIVRHVRTCR